MALTDNNQANLSSLKSLQEQMNYNIKNQSLTNNSLFDDIIEAENIPEFQFEDNSHNFKQNSFDKIQGKQNNEKMI